MDHAPPRPYTLVAELTYRCPLQCVYCSNPVRPGSRAELDADVWCRALAEASELGVVQVHFTGGEPLLYPALERLVTAARARDLYVNLVTSGVPSGFERLRALERAGLEHVQLSFQGVRAEDGERFARSATFEQKRNVARWVKELGLSLTVNFVLHRHNIDDIEAMVAMGAELGAERVELANSQYLGWAFENRDALLPTQAQIVAARAAVATARTRWPGLGLDFVLPDYHAGLPRACMDGWAQRYVVIAPDGRVLPCHAASAIPGLEFESVAERPLGLIWQSSPALARFRGDAWLGEPCRSCPRAATDHGGCRCQAFLLTGDPSAADPACELTASHHLVRLARSRAESHGAPGFRYRKLAG
jgi:pyrroloquinoline quinone biosynthesis protein E